jgi:hypothetical protein
MIRPVLVSLLLLCFIGCYPDEVTDRESSADILPPYNLRSITGDGSIELVFDILQSKYYDDLCGIDIYVVEGNMLDYTGKNPYQELDLLLDDSALPIFDVDPDDDIYITPYFSLDDDAISAGGYWLPQNDVRWGVNNIENGTTYTIATTAYDCESGERSKVSNIITDTPCETVSPSPVTAVSGQWLDLENLQVVDCESTADCDADLQLTAVSLWHLQLESFSAAGVLSAGAWLDFAESSLAPSGGYQAMLIMSAGAGVSLYVLTRNGLFGRIDVESYDGEAGLLTFSMRVQKSEVDSRQL